MVWKSSGKFLICGRIEKTGRKTLLAWIIILTFLKPLGLVAKIFDKGQLF